MKVDREKENIVGVIGPRQKGNYNLVLPAVVRAIDFVAYEHGSDKAIVFVHDGVYTGCTGEVTEVVNKTGDSLAGYGHIIAAKKMKLDIELHGKKSHDHWIDELIAMEPELVVVFDDQKTAYLKTAIKKLEKSGTPNMIVPVKFHDK